MKIDMLGFRIDEWEISNTDPDQTCAISPRQLVALLKALENACEDRNRPTQSSPLSSWLEGFEAGCELSRNRQGVSLSSLPPLLRAAAAFSPAGGLAPVQSDMPDSCPSVPEGSIASQALSDSDQSSSDSSASSCVEADKARNTGDGMMPSPGITAGPDDFDAVLAQRHGERLEIVTGQGGVSGFMHGIRPPTLANALNTHAMVMRLFANAQRLNAKIKALRRGATTGAAGSKARQKGQPRG